MKHADTDHRAGGGIRPKALQLSAMTRLASDRHSTTGSTNLLVQMRLISYRIKMETFMFVAEFRLCLFHTYIHFLLIKAGHCATKKFKR